ncbi:MAG: alpha-L-fucosidase [Cyclobacteriaceae bacterium]|nr:alpha-L-fucosidase [Cyclobacteriaceae bacterium]
MKNVLFFYFVLVLPLVSCRQGPDIPPYLHDYADLYQQDPRNANLNWFKDAGFGMFIHYGIYSLTGRGEWVQLRDTIPLDEYALLKDQFTAENFDAEVITDLAISAGMKYITITTKHHDGFCLFRTAQTDFNSMNAPCGRDLIAELAAACDKKGLGLFLYYSYAADWKHPYFYDREDGWLNARPAYAQRPNAYLYKQPEDFRVYVDFVHAQLEELITQYPNVAGIWFDPIMGFYAKPDIFPIEETYNLIRKLSPHALISFKQGANGSEDFVAPERGGTARVGEQYEVARKVYELNKNKPKEVCNTMQPHISGYGAAWGYNKAMDGHHLSVDDVKKLLDDAKKEGYNLLLNIGPMPDGSVHPEDVATLSALKD